MSKMIYHRLGQRRSAGFPLNLLGRVVAVLLFAVVLLAIALGLGYIVAHGFGYTLAFDGLLPSIVKR